MASCSPLKIFTSFEYIEPDPETYAAIMPVIREYFYYRKQAIISGSTEQLFSRYPELKRDIELSKGINAEEFHIKNYRQLQPVDGNIFPEYYEKIKLKIDHDKAEVLLHGMELYLFSDENNEYQDSGGELKMIIHMQRKNDRWCIYKTDEVTQSEWREFSP